MRFDLPDHVLTALNLLEKAGFEAWLVGGCVRDAYLGRVPGDIDIATSALPEQMLAVFSPYKTLQTGRKHGTITLLINHHPMEITTFRSDGRYTDRRHPDQVQFVTSLQEDLARRDFTCNAMAWHPQGGLQDPFDGRKDCDRNLLRAVGIPRKRFEEDALRILRALRFACQLGFSIEENTCLAMMDAAEGLQHIAKERIANELNRALTGDHAARALGSYPRVLFLALPELAPMLHTPQRTPFHIYDVWQHTLRTLEETPKDTAIRWAALYHDSGKPHTTTIDPDGTTHFRGHQAVSTRLMEEAMQRQKQSGVLREQATSMVKYHDERIGPDNLRLWLSRLGYPLTLKLLLLQRADLAAHSPKVAWRLPQIDVLYKEAIRLQKTGTPLHIRDLAVDGKDLMDIGYQEDERLGQALSRLLELVLKGTLSNTQEALMVKAKELLKQDGSF